MAGTCANSNCAANGTKRCTGCKQASYCSTTCQKQDWQHHKSACKSSVASSAKTLPKERSTVIQKEDREGHESIPASTSNDSKVKAVMIHSQADGGGRYSTFHIPRGDPLFKTTPVPISQKIGYPLLLQRADSKSDLGALSDNPHATWLMIDPATGVAPAAWQSQVGNVVVARADGKALEVTTLGAITDYISDIMEAFGEGVGAARRYYDRGRLDGYIEDHLEMQREFQRLQLQGDTSMGAEEI